MHSYAKQRRNVNALLMREKIKSISQNIGDMSGMLKQMSEQMGRGLKKSQ